MTDNERETLRDTWKQHLETWKQSGQSQVDYCREQGLKSHQMTYWKNRFIKSMQPPKLIPVKLPGLARDRFAAVVVTLPDGVRLEVPCEQAVELLPTLLSALKSAS